MNAQDKMVQSLQAIMATREKATGIQAQNMVTMRDAANATP
jgi:hypothetical protein